MNIQLLNNFPSEYKPNEAQEYILSELSKALESDHKYIIIQAPTASGKSMISKTLANMSNEPEDEYCRLVQNDKILHPGVGYEPSEHPYWGCAILTSTKSLQDQYGNLFADGSVAKGKVNYPCDISDELNCQHGYCMISPNQKDKCYKECRCPYMNALKSALVNKCAFYSYSMYGCLNSKIKRRQFVVCDEASELENEIVSEYSASFNLEYLKKVVGIFPPTPSSIQNKTEWWVWLQNISALATSIMSNLTHEAQKNKKLPKAKYTQMRQLTDLLTMLNTITDSWDMTEYIIQRTETGIEFKPYQVNQLAGSFFNHAERVILMSATIVDVKRFAATLGINEYYYIDAPCTLDAKKAPILCSNDTWLSYKTKDQVLPKIMSKVQKVCDTFSTKKGLIHTHSMEILRYVKKNINDNDRCIYREDGVVNESVLKAHSESDKPTIMVSPSMTHGIDLKGELGEFQIIMKAPYPPLGDARVKKKFEADKQWYTNCMLSTLIQAAGRCNRVKSDESVTFIMDTNAVEAIKRNKNILPKYFLDRIR